MQINSFFIFTLLEGLWVPKAIRRPRRANRWYHGGVREEVWRTLGRKGRESGVQKWTSWLKNNIILSPHAYYKKPTPGGREPKIRMVGSALTLSCPFWKKCELEIPPFIGREIVLSLNDPFTARKEIRMILQASSGHRRAAPGKGGWVWPYSARKSFLFIPNYATRWDDGSGFRILVKYLIFEMDCNWSLQSKKKSDGKAIS